jgi:Domain of unknown function (DUF2427)
MVVSGFCGNCTHLAPNAIDVTNTKQQFIYAVGPPVVAPYSSSPAAPLREHLYYGRFTMDMTQSLGTDMPQFGNSTSPGVVDGGLTRDGNYAESGHAFVMVLAWLVLFPIGIIMVRVFERIRLHLFIQTAVLVLAVLGLITGSIISTFYERVCFPLICP